jgi:Uncharacterized conserved protein
MQQVEVKIKTEYITLDNLLKYAGLVGTGGEAKYIISIGEVDVDGELELRRGRKIRPENVVTVGDVVIKVEAT